jgi:hypothetical protein
VKQSNYRKLCPLCVPKIVRYEDAVANEAHRLKMVSDLCLATTQAEFVSPQTLQEVGLMIKEFLERESIAQWFCFGSRKALSAWHLDERDPFVRAELVRLKGNETD